MMKKWKFYVYDEDKLNRPRYKVTVYAEEYAEARSKAESMVGWQDEDPSLISLIEIEDVL